MFSVPSFRNLAARTAHYSRRQFSASPLVGEGILGSPTLKDDYDTVIVAYTDLYGRLLGKRYDLDYFLKSGSDLSKACNYTLAMDMPMNPLDGFKFASWSQGFGDFSLKPDLSTLRPAAWTDKSLIVLCDVHDPNTGELVPIAPRSMLKNALSKLNSTLGKKEGEIKVNAATELEHYLYNNTYEECAQLDYRINPSNSFTSVNFKSENYITPAGFYPEDYHILQGSRNEDFTRTARNALKASGVSVETSKGETGVGQHELNVKYDECLKMADTHMIFKQCLKEVAMQQGKSVTFMAKPVHYDAGSSCHVHLSIFDASTGQNLFYKQPEETTAANVSSAFQEGGELDVTSKLFRNFLGGWMGGLNDFFTFYCPTVNSYKRMVSGSWAPTAAAFGIDNRTAGFRVITDHKSGADKTSLRVECRIPGADVNPYLLLAASVLGGANGIANGVEPGEMLRGDGYSMKVDGVEPVPSSLKAATENLASSSSVREMLGEDVQEHYARFYQLEWEAYEKYVTDWERKRYFEHI